MKVPAGWEARMSRYPHPYDNDNRDKDAVISELQDRITALLNKIHELETLVKEITNVIDNDK